MSDTLDLIDAANGVNLSYVVVKSIPYTLDNSGFQTIYVQGYGNALGYTNPSNFRISARDPVTGGIETTVVNTGYFAGPIPIKVSIGSPNGSQVTGAITVELESLSDQFTLPFGDRIAKYFGFDTGRLFTGLSRTQSLTENLGWDVWSGSFDPDYHSGTTPAKSIAELRAADIHCFPATTPIQTSLTSTTPISNLRIGDVVLAFDPYTDNGRGALVPRRVTKLFSNITTEWVKLSWVEAGVARELVATPGHHFLDQFGNFPAIADMIRDGGATVVLASGELVEVRATRIVYSAATAHLFEQAQSHIAVSGNTALKPQMLAGWQTYNFEAEDLHTYAADFSNDNFNVQRIAA